MPKVLEKNDFFVAILIQIWARFMFDTSKANALYKLQLKIY